MPAPHRRIKVLIADSQHLLSSALAVALAKRQSFEVVPARPGSPEEAVAAVERHKPDVVLCDYWLEGPSTTRRMLAAVPQCKIIMTSWMISSEHISSALAAGAAGFLPQSAGLEDAVEAIRSTTTTSASLVFSAELARFHEGIERRAEQTASWGRAFDRLTPRQWHILRLLSMGKLIHEISKELGIAPVTVKWHIRRILAETGTRSQAEVLAVARYAGVITP